VRTRVQPHEPDPSAVEQAVRVLRSGGIVALPTETVYGLCVDASDAAAVERLIALKGRPEGRDFAYLLGDREAASRHVPELPRPAARLAARFWPGPLTLVVPGEDGAEVGLRLPDLAVAREIAARAGRPLFQTSANRSGEPAALDADGVRDALGDGVQMLLDGGPVAGGRPSTVVRCAGRCYEILRPGAISSSALARAATQRVLIACTGNLCRSPIAEAFLRRELAGLLSCDEAQLPRYGFRIRSFGTTALDGRAATENAIQVAEEHELDIRRHRSRRFRIRPLKQALRVYCLAECHRAFLLPYFTGAEDRLELLDPDGKEIPDPYGRSLRFYRKTAERIAAACERRAGELFEA
jgi:protein-tyrosine phosphatase